MLRYVIPLAVIVLLILLAVYIGLRKYIHGYSQYYSLGKTCYNRADRTFNDVLDRDVLASDQVSDLESRAYLHGREVAEKKYLAAIERYRKFVIDEK